MPNAKPVILETHSPEETAGLGRALGTALQVRDVVALVGPLGAGKTQFTKGLARGIGAPGRVTSPTFKLVNEYTGRIPLYHLDAYRLHGADDLIALGCDEFFDGEGAAVVEWADRVAEALPADHLRIDLSITGPAARRLVFHARGVRSAQLLASLRSAKPSQ